MSLKKEIKVVILEDDHYYNKVLTRYVETICDKKTYPSYSFNIKSYHTANEAIQELEDDTDILLLDYYLNDEEELDNLNGADVLKEVNKHCDNCKVIMISGQEEQGLKEVLMELGITEYIDKNLNSRNRVGAVMQRVIKELDK